MSKPNQNELIDIVTNLVLQVEILEKRVKDLEDRTYEEVVDGISE